MGLTNNVSAANNEQDSRLSRQVLNNINHDSLVMRSVLVYFIFNELRLVS